MNDRKPVHKPALSTDGAASACPPIVGHTMTIGGSGSAKTMYDVFRLIADDASDAGDEACA